MFLEKETVLQQPRSGSKISNSSRSGKTEKSVGVAVSY
jgi:hypothetical protein